MTDCPKYLSAGLLGFATMAAAVAPALAGVPSLGKASSYTVLSATPANGGVVTCTDASVIGNIGSSGFMPAVTWTRCTTTGAIVAPVAARIVADFNSAYDALATAPCDRILTGSLANVKLAPGVYCFDEAATLTGTLTLAGSAYETWTFLVDGDLTGTDFSVVMAGDGRACNVYWGPAGAATMTTSNLKGNILAGEAITLTGGTFVGRAQAVKAVTLTGVAVTGC